MALRRLQLGARIFGTVLELSSSGRGVAACRASTAAAAAVESPAGAATRAWLQTQHAPALHTYTLHITTGNLRGAGSLAPAFVTLVGANGKSERVIVGDSDENSLARGTCVTVTVNANEDLGPLRFVNVQRLGNSISDAGTGWFLEHVVVHTPDRSRLVFPCHSWFGEADSGGMRGPLERNLLPQAALERGEAAQGLPVKLSVSGVAVPHPDKVKIDGAKGVNRKGFGHGGEDSYFYAAGKGGVFGMGVADGVYMWREAGIDSGDFSRSLMRIAEASVRAGTADVVKVLEDAAMGAKAAGVQGSSTACIVLVNQPRGQLFAANLGDSGCLLLRPEAAESGASGVVDYIVKFRTNQLEHEFGRPYQLGHHAAADSVDKCDVATQTVRPGDVLVLGSDGLFDNLNDGEIADEVASCRGREEGPAMMAQRLARLAFQAAYDKSRLTPYAAAASEHFDMCYSGGKPDDITVLVGICE
ncbi:hypothetical protein HYH03_005833 [Edaphochlamys debaryana]|uniref:Protein phosphatase n=1 Tax=Edaphochlamys debaryana TaxID=47281 RepID=A0A835YCA5_9CHLO|nr:hypothetical protein HYH03_005833 [Edaphochlamys debaryana]|eukprot:KAG2496235.1 hypothetical protein HYH03_005833 [Edaphochlamys debaryana]